MNIGELLDRQAISLRASATDKRKVLALIAEIAARNFHLDAGDVLDALIERARPFCWVSNTLAAGVEVEYGRVT